MEGLGSSLGRSLRGENIGLKGMMIEELTKYKYKYRFHITFQVLYWLKLQHFLKWA